MCKSQIIVHLLLCDFVLTKMSHISVSLGLRGRLRGAVYCIDLYAVGRSFENRLCAQGTFDSISIARYANVFLWCRLKACGLVYRLALILGLVVWIH